MRASLSLLVVVCLTFLAFLSSFSAAQTTACGGLGYDLSSITTTDLLYTDPAGVPYALRPCGTVTTAGYCAGSLCMANNTISVYDPTNQYVDGYGSPRLQLGWAALPNGAGIVQQIQDGSDAPGSCGWEGQYYSGTIEYVCDTTATTPVLTNVTQLASYSCHYQAIVHTSAACPTATTTALASQPGASVLSQSCGGGFYTLTGTGFDTGFLGLFVNNSNGQYEYIATLCEPIPDPPVNCQWQSNGYYSANFTNVCQYQTCCYGDALAVWEPTVFVPVWTYLGPGALSYTLQDGTGCLGEFNRYTNVTILCNQSATTAFIQSVEEQSTCHYYITMQSSAVCGPAAGFPGLPIVAPGGGGSSSSAVSAASSVSVVSSSSSAVSTAGSSSSASTAASSSSSTGGAVTSSSSTAAASPSSSVAPSSSSAPAATSSSTAAAASSSSSSTAAVVTATSSSAAVSSSTAAPTVASSSTASPTSAAVTSSPSTAASTAPPVVSSTNSPATSASSAGVAPTAASSSAVVVVPSSSSSAGGAPTTPASSAPSTAATSSVMVLVVAMIAALLL